MLLTGRGNTHVAKRLNREGVPAPRRRWSGGTVRKLARRPIYKGVIEYGRQQRAYREGTKVLEPGVLSELVVAERPALAIVSAEVWQRVQGQLDEDARASTAVHAGGRPMVGKYLLSGLVECAVCAGGMHVGKRPREAEQYFCTAHRQLRTCTNHLGAPMLALHEGLIAGLETRVFAPDIIRDAIEQYLDEREAERRGATDRLGALGSERAKVEAEAQRLVEAIKRAGPPLRILVEALQANEQRRREIDAQVRMLDDPAPREDRRALRRLVAARLDRWRELLERHPAEARATIIRPLLAGRVVLTPIVVGSARRYGWRAPLAPGDVLTGLISPSINPCPTLTRRSSR
jgi:recombinase/recombinase-like zinc beta ribbon protein